MAMDSHNQHDPETQSPDPQNPEPKNTYKSRIIQKLGSNLHFHSKWGELNGAMGDLGTYIPIVLTLTLAKDLNLGTTLIFTGLYNIITGVIYGVPMPVQPMKSIAAVAISSGPDFGIPEIMAAGICTGGVLFVLGVTGMMQVVYKLVPISVVRGIQLSQGLNFAMSAVKYIRNVHNFSKSSKALGQRPWLGLDGLVLAIVCVFFIVFVNGSGGESGSDEPGLEGEGRRKGWGRKLRKVVFGFPSAFLIFVLGVILTFMKNPDAAGNVSFGPSPIEVIKISKSAWKEGFVKGAIPQLPLSILNSVIAVCKLSSDLFPGKDFSASSVSVTVGLMNIVGCWFGAMPTCHGAGGLAGQYKFGGRSGGCVALLGAAKLVLGLVLGSSLVMVLRHFPVGVLGVLLLFAGIELAMACRDMTTKEESFVMLICTAVSLVGSSAALGFLCGMVIHVLLKTRSRSQ